MMTSPITDRHSVTDPRNTVTPPHGLSNECACGKPAVIAFDNRSRCYECSHRAGELPESISTADRSRAYRKRVSRGKVQFTIEVKWRDTFINWDFQLFISLGAFGKTRH